MVYKILFFVLGLGPSLLFVGCINDHKEPVTSSPVALFFDKEIKLFDFKYDDSSVMIYSENRGFDTSYVFVVNKVNSHIRGKVFYYPPAYYSSFSDAENASIFLFKGASYSINTNEWNKLAIRLQELVNKFKKPLNPDKTGIIHPFKRKIFWKGLLISNEEYGDAFFEEIYTILKQYILDNILSSYPYINDMPV